MRLPPGYASRLISDAFGYPVQLITQTYSDDIVIRPMAGRTHEVSWQERAVDEAWERNR